MRSLVLLLFCSLTYHLCSQVTIGKPWHFEIGASTCNGFGNSFSYNIRYISPHFRWSNYEGTDDEDKYPERFKNSRIMFELIYSPPFEVLCIGINLQSRFLHYKRFTLDLYGGPRFFIKEGPDFKYLYLLAKSTDGWYFNFGILVQVNLGFLSPFVDAGGDGIFTVGTEINLQPVYKKLKRRYKLKTKPYNTQ